MVTSRSLLFTTLTICSNFIPAFAPWGCALSRTSWWQARARWRSRERGRPMKKIPRRWVYQICSHSASVSAAPSRNSCPLKTCRNSKLYIPFYKPSLLGAVLALQGLSLQLSPLVRSSVLSYKNWPYTQFFFIRDVGHFQLQGVQMLVCQLWLLISRP